MSRNRVAQVALLLACVLVPINTAAAQGGRNRVLLDAAWKFEVDKASELANPATIQKWRWVVASGSPKLPGGRFAIPADGAPWAPAALHEDTFKGRIGYSWYRAALPTMPETHRVATFTAVDDNADVFLNGLRLIHHEGYNTAFSVGLDWAWKKDGQNTLLVLVENTQGPGEITGDVIVGNHPTEDVAPVAPGFDDSRWRTVNVPHDYVIDQPFTRTADENHAYLPTPPAWYRKTIVIPIQDQGKDHWLDFDGLYRDAKIYINGKFFVEHQSGYTPVHLDISSQARPGHPLTIAVHLDPSQFEGWWYEGGGIYRHVWLTSVNRLHISPEGVWVIPTAVGSEAHPASADIDARLTLRNTGIVGHRYSVVERVFDPSGHLVASRRAAAAYPLAPGATAVSDSRITLAAPKLWSLGRPNIYKLQTVIDVHGRPVDEVRTTFGVRTVRFDPDKGFFLNGKSIKIKGVCNHQDYAGIGIAVRDNLEYWRVRKFLDMGANAWRTAHNPPTVSLLDACDRLGMLVLDENRHLGDTYAQHTYSADTTANSLSDLNTMIVRDRNHPCIVAWSLCNEEPLQGTEAGAGLFKTMMDRVHALDPTRLVTCAMNHDWGKGISRVEDMQGCNYLVENFRDFHKNFPHQPMIFTESSSAVQDRGIYTNDWVHAYIGDYTNPKEDWLNWVRRTEDAWRPIAENDYLSGSFVWAGFSYKGEPSPFGWPNISSHYGILDTCGFPKDDYYYYKVYWGDKPALHIAPHWTWPGSDGRPIEVVVFSNQPIVDLLLNGVSLGRKSCPPNGHAEWLVPYAPGLLVAKGYDAVGRLMATEVEATAGKPCRIQLRTDLSKLAANGEDVSVIEAAIVDRSGRFMPTAADRVTFDLSGPAGRIAGTDNGDPNDHTRDSSRVRNAFNGRLAAMVRSTGRAGPVTVTATAIGLEPARITINFQ